MQISKQFHFEAAHVLPGYPGKCSRVHGHSYLLEVAMEGSLLDAGPFAGMVVDFAILGDVVKREIVDVWDHHFLSAAGVEVTVVREPQVQALVDHGYEADIVSLPILRTTAECLADYIFRRLSRELNDSGYGGIRVTSVTLWETATSKATCEEGTEA